MKLITKHLIIDDITQSLQSGVEYVERNKKTIVFRYYCNTTTLFNDLVKQLAINNPDIIIKVKPAESITRNICITVKMPNHYFNNFIPVVSCNRFSRSNYKTVACPHCKGSGKIRVKKDIQ